MLKLENDYLRVIAERNDIQEGLLDVRIHILRHKPIEQHKIFLKEMRKFMLATFTEHFGSSYHADTATKIMSDTDSIILLNESKLPIIKNYSFYIEDLFHERKLERDLLINAAMDRTNCGLITEETLLLIEAFRSIYGNLPYIDFWEWSDEQFWDWDDAKIWADCDSKRCEVCQHRGKCVAD